MTAHTLSSAAATDGRGANNPRPVAPDFAARLAMSAADHLLLAEAFDREPILKQHAAAERVKAAVQLRLALAELEPMQ